MESDVHMTFMELIKKERVFAPCIWDCMSAKASEMSGYKAAVLSSGCMSFSLRGMPDMGVVTLDETIAMTERITNVSPLHLIVDAEDGYGESPINSYWTAKRLAKAGASAIMIDDTTGIRGWQRIMHGDMSSYEVTKRSEWLGKIQAALDALEGTDCILIARTEAMYKYGIEEAIERCVEAEKLGVPMTLIIGLRNINHCIQVNEHVKGLKMYPDVFAKNGIPDVELDDVEKLNFRLITMHCLETAAMKGMVEYGTMNFRNQNTVYSTSQGMGDLIPKGMDPFGKMKWIDLEEKYLEMFKEE